MTPDYEWGISLSIWHKKVTKSIHTRDNIYKARYEIYIYKSAVFIHVVAVYASKLHPLATISRPVIQAVWPWSFNLLSIGGACHTKYSLPAPTSDKD